MKKARRLYKQHHGQIIDEHEVHHILPTFAGGTNKIENLVALSKEEHRQAHLDRYEKHGDFRDLCAYHMIGYNFTEAHKISSSEGGKIGGAKVKAMGVGLFRSEEDRRLWASMGGKVGGKVQAELGLGFHQYKNNPELHKKWSSMGGKASGVFQNSKMQADFGRRGGVKNKGCFGYTDSEGKHKKYTVKQQEQQCFEEFLLTTGFKRGFK